MTWVNGFWFCEEASGSPGGCQPHVLHEGSGALDEVECCMDETAVVIVIIVDIITNIALMVMGCLLNAVIGF